MPRRGLIALVGALAFSLLLPPLFDGLPLRGQRALAITLITIVLWTTRGLDAGVTALLGIALLGSSGAAGNFRQALAGFANPVPYFLVGVLAMGVAVARSGLAAALTFLLPSATTRSGILVHIYEEVFGLGWRGSRPAPRSSRPSCSRSPRSPVE